MGFQPSTEKHILALVIELLRQGEFTVHELFATNFTPVASRSD